MARRRFAWGLSLGLMLTGWLLAHSLAYRVAVRDPEERRHLLETSGHGYLDTAPLLSLALTLVAIGFVGRALAGRGGGGPAPLWAFAALPLAGFVVQEHVERALHTGEVPYLTLLEPTFATGLVLQLPLALAAFVLARALLACAQALSHRLGGAPRPRLQPFALLAAPAPSPARPRPSLLASGRGQRAPPSTARL